ncbi:hypothetical protein ONZ51_g6003 [Trametes cubensis]|uniref:Uncharacterized protein n=1 Tax=Trametes cubensis TaxID=1111947 RepID=A0AAD7TV42_9APHY|nr:hypothetical protein ONZ51_g6003 [Trametes cubensis]
MTRQFSRYENVGQYLPPWHVQLVAQTSYAEQPSQGPHVHLMTSRELFLQQQSAVFLTLEGFEAGIRAPQSRNIKPPPPSCTLTGAAVI